MRPITIILIVVSLLAGFGAVFLGKRYLERSAREAAARQEEMRRDVDVLVAAKDLQQGHMLVDGDLAWVPWPVPTARAAKVVTRQDGKAPLDLVPARYLRRNVIAGEPVTDKLVFKPGTGGLMPGMLEPGMKAIGVRVTAASAASGFVLPGDRVDVILTMKHSGPGGAGVFSETVLADVRIMGVDQEITSTGERSKSSSKTKKKSKEAPEEEKASVAMVGRTVALEVTAAQARRLLAADTSGSLSLVLRSLAAGTEEEERGVPFATDLDASRALKEAAEGGPKVIRGGQVGRQ